MRAARRGAQQAADPSTSGNRIKIIKREIRDAGNILLQALGDMQTVAKQLDEPRLYLDLLDLQDKWELKLKQTEEGVKQRYEQAIEYVRNSFNDSPTDCTVLLFRSPDPDETEWSCQVPLEQIAGHENPTITTVAEKRVYGEDGEVKSFTAHPFIEIPGEPHDVCTCGDRLYNHEGGICYHEIGKEMWDVMYSQELEVSHRTFPPTSFITTDGSETSVQSQ